jgi:hypothetical protein
MLKLKKNILSIIKFLNSSIDFTPSKTNFSIILVMNLITFFLFSYFLPIEYETNDDVIMMCLASGRYTGLFEPNLVFINFILGIILNFFYKSFPIIEWYTVFLSIVYIFSITIIFISLLKKNYIVFYFLLFLVLIKSFEFYLICNFQFTLIASFSSIAGLLLFQSSVKRTNICGTFFLVIASLIRFKVLFLVCIIFSPFIIKSFLKNLRNFSTFRKKLIESKFVIAFGTLLLIIVFNYLNTERYLNIETKENFLVTSESRAYIVDNPNTFYFKDFENLPNRISKNEFLLFSWHFYDPCIFDLPSIKNIDLLIKRISFFEKIVVAYHNLKNDFEKYFILFFLLTITSIIYTNDKKDKLLIIFSFLVFVCISFYISLNSLLKHRVFLCITITFIIQLILFINKEKTYNKTIFLFYFILIQFTLFFLLPIKIWGLLSLATILVYLITLGKTFNGKMVLFFTLIIAIAFLFVDRALWAYSKGTKQKILTDQVTLLNNFYSQSKNFVFPFRSDLMIDGINPFKFNNLN